MAKRGTVWRVEVEGGKWSVSGSQQEVRKMESHGKGYTKKRYKISVIIFRALWKNPINVKLGNMTMYSSPPPGSGALLAFIMNVLEGVDFHKEEKTLYQYIVETFKWAYARRTELGDPDFELQVSKFVNFL